MVSWYDNEWGYPARCSNGARHREIRFPRRHGMNVIKCGREPRGKRVFIRATYVPRRGGKITDDPEFAVGAAVRHALEAARR